MKSTKDFFILLFTHQPMAKQKIFVQRIGEFLSNDIPAKKLILIILSDATN